MGELIFPLVTEHLLLQPKNPNNLFDEEWAICMKNGEQQNIGALHFEDGNFHGEVQIKVDLDPAYIKAGFDTEIFYSMARFVFRFKDIREIRTVCRYDEEERAKGLEKAGFVYRERQDANVYYSMKKQKSSWTGLYIMVGMVAGIIIGITISNLWVGTIGGVLIGTIIGYILDKRVDKETL